MKLYSYCLRYDNGAAPNPYWGTCTLAICKPVIRRKAEVGDWIVGIGSKNSPVGDISNSAVYAMQVTRVLSMREYDEFCHIELPGKIPDWRSSDYRRRVGDCIYDFSAGENPILREGVHTVVNRETDLSGANVLLSKHFNYFGDSPVQLPEHLLPIVHQTQGHKSHVNDEFTQPFVEFINGLSVSSTDLLGEPQMKRIMEEIVPGSCRSLCAKQDEEDNSHAGIC